MLPQAGGCDPLAPEMSARYELFVAHPGWWDPAVVSLQAALLAITLEHCQGLAGTATSFTMAVPARARGWH